VLGVQSVFAREDIGRRHQSRFNPGLHDSKFAVLGERIITQRFEPPLDGV
jgi:hypothetical protein